MGMKIEVKVDSHIKDITTNIDNRIKRALKLMGETVEGYAKDDCPVDTGRLRNSITHEGIEEFVEAVGSSVEYAPYVEFNDMQHKVGKAHFLRDGAANHIPELQSIAAKALSSDNV